MKRKILLIPQNSSHIENFLGLYEKFRTSDFEVEVLNLDSLFHQNLNFSFFDKVTEFKYVLNIPFYKLSNFQKVRVLLNLPNVLFSVISSYDAVVFGNDGAIQRLILRQLKRKNKKVLSFIILDGIISDYSFGFKDIFRHSDNRAQDILTYFFEKFRIIYTSILNTSPYNCFFPSMVGQTRVESYFVIGDHSKEVIAKRNNSEIYPYGLPRYEQFFSEKINENLSLNQTIVYLTSAFKWHGKHRDHDLQLRDIKQIQESILRIKLETGKCIQMIIKIHPRESKEDYLMFEGDSTRLIKDIKLEELYRSRALLLSTISTCILEATLFNKTVYSLFLNFPFWKYHRSFIQEKDISKIFNLEELDELITSYLEGKINKTITSNRLIANTLPSTDLIFEKISSKLR